MRPPAPWPTTGNDLDLAIEGSAYFKVQTRTGPAYTRNGAFQVSTTGQLTTASGDTVLGESGPIQLPRGKVGVSPDGTISVDGALAGKLKLVTFAAGTRPTSHGTAYYAAPAAAEQPATNVAVRQGSLESSNVSPVEGMVQLISAQRAAESMRHVLSMLDGEMDKTAATGARPRQLGQQTSANPNTRTSAARRQRQPLTKGTLQTHDPSPLHRRQRYGRPADEPRQHRQ